MKFLKSITELLADQEDLTQAPEDQDAAPEDQDDTPEGASEKRKFIAVVKQDDGTEIEKKVKAFSIDDIKHHFGKNFVSAELHPDEQGEEAEDDDQPAAGDAGDADLEESLFKSVVTEASLGSRVGFDSYEEWDLSLPPKHTMHRDGKIKRAQARGKDFEGVAGQWDEEKMEGWIYTYYLNKKNLAEAKFLNFPTFYSFCLQHGVSEDELDDVIDNAYDQDTDEFVLAKEVKQAIGKADIKSAKEKALKAIKFLAKFTITGTGAGAKKAQALVDKFAEAAYKHLVAHWTDLNEEAPVLKEGLAQDLTKVLKGLGYKLDSKESTAGELKSWWVHPSQKHEISAAALAKALAPLDPSVKAKPNYQFPKAQEMKNATDTGGDLLRTSFQNYGTLFVSVYKKKAPGKLAKRDIEHGIDPDIRNEGLSDWKSPGGQSVAELTRGLASYKHDLQNALRGGESAQYVKKVRAKISELEALIAQGKANEGLTEGLTQLAEMAKRTKPDDFYAMAKKKYGADKVKSLKWPEIVAVAKENDVLIPPYLRTQKVGRGSFNLVPPEHADTKPTPKEEPKAEAPKVEPKKEEYKMPQLESASYTEWSEFYRELKKRFGDFELERVPHGEQRRDRRGTQLGDRLLIDKKTGVVMGVWEVTGSDMIPGRGNVAYGRGTMAREKQEAPKVAPKPAERRAGGNASDDELKTALLDVASEMKHHKDNKGADWRTTPEKEGKRYNIEVRHWGHWEGDDGSGDYDYQELSRTSSKEIASILKGAEQRHKNVKLSYESGEKNWLYIYAE
jgi:hypothetical protein